jgi:hypothetical protein
MINQGVQGVQSINGGHLPPMTDERNSFIFEYLLMSG